MAYACSDLATQGTAVPTATSPFQALKWAGFMLGFSLGGFFDGILLHQILQWHHLLSNVDAVAGIRGQILADGLFHAFMYLIAVVALWRLWRVRSTCAAPGASIVLWATALIGFGGWHIVDAAFSHWITGIHRIKLDAPNPIVWDLIWFFAFGIVPALIGWWMLRKTHPGGGQRGRAAAAVLALAAMVAGPIAALPAGNSNQVLVLFAPGVSSAVAFNALARLDARVLWNDRSGAMWAVSLQDPGTAWRLYREGAMLVSSSNVALGCFSWMSVAESADVSGAIKAMR